jgi:integrase
MKLLLSADTLAGLRIPENRNRLTVSDLACPGLSIELRRPKGASWRMRYTYEKIQHCITLGKIEQMNLDEARALGYEIKKLVLQKQDPMNVLNHEIKSHHLTFEKFIEQYYLPHIQSYKRCVSADITLLKNHLLPAFGSQPLSRITRLQVVEFLQSKVSAGYKPGYCNRFLILLGFCFNLAIKWDIPGVQKNPVQGVSLLKNLTKTERVLNPHEIDGLLKALADSPNPLLKYFVSLALLTGARKRELLDARWRDFDLAAAIWCIPMTKSGRALSIPLSSEAVSLLKELKENSPNTPQWAFNEGDWIFPNPKTGKPFVSIFNSWNSARTKAGLKDLRVHDLRHSFASALVNHGIPIYDVQKLLGHQSVRTTERYSHLSLDRLRISTGAAAKQYAQFSPIDVKVA